MTYTISNTEGRSGITWGSEYETREEAAEAIRCAMGWDSVVLSESFATDAGTGWCAYQDAEDCDADAEGAYAPRIERP